MCSSDLEIIVAACHFPASYMVNRRNHSTHASLSRFSAVTITRICKLQPTIEWICGQNNSDLRILRDSVFVTRGCSKERKKMTRIEAIMTESVRILRTIKFQRSSPEMPA